MADKPADFFLGALDLFGILVPGAVGAAAVLVVDPKAVEPVIGLLPTSGAERTIALVVTAYLLGYPYRLPTRAIRIASPRRGSSEGMSASATTLVQ
jgi:hypothetical protein